MVSTPDQITLKVGDRKANRPNQRTYRHNGQVEQHKKGRTISGFSFKFKQKQQPKIEKPVDPKRDPNSPDFFIDMTDSQRHLFAHKLSEMPDMSKYSQGSESYQQFAVRIAGMLLDPVKFRELYPLLKKAGFKHD